MTTSASPRTIRPGMWQADRGATTATFAVRNMLLMTVTGTIPVTGASVRVAADGTPTEVVAELAPQGFSTGNDKRDEHVRGPEFLDAAAHPVMRFTSERIVATGDGWTVVGSLALRGVTTTVELAVTVTELGGESARVRARGRIDRHQAGVTAMSNLMIGKDVAIDLDVTLRHSLQD
ncbi:YceI family protein [Streptomyces sp. NPDC047928]|uniref:YceI family protein n=1 Tax=unclassified Streptomyces TaxID=2593676 RepID=UPI00371570C9